MKRVETHEEMCRRALYESCCETLEQARVLASEGRKDIAFRLLRGKAVCMTPDSALWEWFGPEMAEVLGLKLP